MHHDVKRHYILVKMLKSDITNTKKSIALMYPFGDTMSSRNALWRQFMIYWHQNDALMTPDDARWRQMTPNSAKSQFPNASNGISFVALFSEVKPHAMSSNDLLPGHPVWHLTPAPWHQWRHGTPEWRQMTSEWCAMSPNTSEKSFPQCFKKRTIFANLCTLCERNWFRIFAHLPSDTMT